MNPVGFNVPAKAEPADEVMVKVDDVELYPVPDSVTVALY